MDTVNSTHFMPQKNPSQPLRRLLTIGGVVLTVVMATLTAIVAYDTPPPDDASFFLPDRPPVPNTENGFALLDTSDIYNSALDPFEIDQIIDNSMWPGVPPTSWDTPEIDRLLALAEPHLQTLDVALAKNVWHSENRLWGGRKRGLPSGLYTSHEYTILAIFVAKHAIHHKDYQKAIAQITKLYTFADKLLDARAGIGGFADAIRIRQSASRLVTELVPHLSDPADLTTLLSTIQDSRIDPAIWETSLRAQYSILKATLLDPTSRQDFVDAYNFAPVGDLLTNHMLKTNLTLKLHLDYYKQAAKSADGRPYSAKTTPRPVYNRMLVFSPNSGGLLTTTDDLFALYACENNLWHDRFRVAATEVLIALQLYQLEHQNQLPTTLSQLVPKYLIEIPQDPYNAQPLHYDPANRKIWAVGENLTNDGGNPHPDLTFDWLDPTIKIPIPTPPQQGTQPQ